MVANDSVSMQDSTADDSMLHLVLDQVEELVAAVIEEIRERPAVALALAAGVVGALIGVRLAARRGRGSGGPAPVRATRRKVRSMGDATELAGLGIRLLQNPIVRGLVLAAIERQLKRRLSL